MKKLFLIALIIPAICKAQCPQWVHSGRDSTIALLNKADSYLQFNLMSKYDAAQQNSIRLFDEHDYCQFTVDFIKAQAFEGSNLVTTYNQVKSIYIKGPKDRMDKFVNEYLMPLLNNCVIKKSGQSIYFGKTLMTIQTTGLVESIKMEYRETAP